MQDDATEHIYSNFYLGTNDTTQQQDSNIFTDSLADLSANTTSNSVTKTSWQSETSYFADGTIEKSSLLSFEKTSSNQFSTLSQTQQIIQIKNTSLVQFTLDLINLSNESLKIINNRLSNRTNDLTGCLLNCSHNGYCNWSSNLTEIWCACKENYTGRSCQTHMHSCLSYPCLNNGTVIYVNSSTCQCKCQMNFYGLNCENKINVCQNLTCQNNGYCFNEQEEAKCKCSIYYSGETCEILGTFIKVVHGVQITTVIIACLSLGIVIFLVVLNDIFNLFIKFKNNKTVNL